MLAITLMSVSGLS